MMATRCPNCFAEVTSIGACAGCAQHGRPRPSPLVLQPGSLLAEQYRIGRVLGEPGGFGITYLGWDTRLETRVAIKEFLPREFAVRDSDGYRVIASLPGQDDPFQWGLRGFLNEARALAKFDHPNIVRVRTYFEGNGTAYIVMNYYDGLSLQDLLDQENRPFSETQTLTLMLPILDGLEVVHGQRLLHRDIKPANVYLAHRSTPILLDFGAARMAVGEKSRNLTEIYTEGFAPLEQYSSRGNQGPWTDIYACAATMFYMVTGSVPPIATERVGSDGHLSLRGLSANLSPAFCNAVERALAVRPAQRPQKVSEFRALLLGTRTAPPRTPTRDRSGGPTAAQIVGCRQCGARNRVPAGRSSNAARCGRCDAGLGGDRAAASRPVVRCPRCNTLNRLSQDGADLGASRVAARCGRCGEPLRDR
jgi:serine/threonine protein kinase